MEVGWLAFRGTNKHVSLWPPRWQDYFLDCGREELEPSYRAISEWEVRLSLASLPQGASRSQLSGAGVRAKDCGSIAWCMGMHDSSWVPWHMLLVARPRPNGIVV